MTKQAKEQAMYALMLGIGFTLFHVNTNLKRHVESCEEASKNVRRVLWLVLGAIVTQLVAFLTLKFLGGK